MHLIPNSYWPVDKLTYLIRFVHIMPIGQLSKNLGKSELSIRKKLERMNYLGKLSTGWNQ